MLGKTWIYLSNASFCIVQRAYNRERAFPLISIFSFMKRCWQNGSSIMVLSCMLII